MKKLTIFIVLALLLTLGATPVYAQVIPALPHAFYGSVTINGDQAPVRTKVEARGPGVITGKGNPIETEVVGIYGTSNPYEQRLIVQGNIKEGEIITFYVNDHPTDQTFPFDSGEVKELPLSVTIAVRRGGGISGPALDYVETTLFGVEESFRISSDGEIQETIEATSADGMLTITISEDTIALDKDGEPLEILEAAVDESPPDPPKDAHIIGLAYDFGPDGATFDPPITFTWSYDPADIPKGVAEKDLVLAYYDEAVGEWVELDCVVDTKNNTITASVEHFTIFAIIGAVTPPAPATFSLSDLTVQPLEVQPKEVVTITVLVANTGDLTGSYEVTLKIDNVAVATVDVTLAGSASQKVTFTTAKDAAGTYTVTVDGLSASFAVLAPAPPVLPEKVEEEEVVEEVVEVPLNWWLLGGLIAAAVVLVSLLIWLILRRRSRAL